MFAGTVPADAKRTAILDAVSKNRVTIVTGDTGTGKTTRTGAFLYEAGYSVVHTLPRRMAARMNASYVAEGLGLPLGGPVGYATGRERKASTDTALLFCTDGLHLVRELHGRGVKGGNQVLIIDELHEWSRQMETLVAWVDARLKEDEDLRVVLMSATIQVEELLRFFVGAVHIEIEGRMFPVEFHQKEVREKITIIRHAVERGENVLVFEPGKNQIERLIMQLDLLGVPAELIPLRGDMLPEEQNKALRRYPRPKVVVATAVAQTSLTIPDITVVVDSGLENLKDLKIGGRRLSLDERQRGLGVETLITVDASQATCRQRMGRAGRTGPGKYYLCSSRRLEDRPEYTEPEIQRTRLDKLVLELAAVGLDATALRFFHQPELAFIQGARETLMKLGALDADGALTPLGQEMGELPVSVASARMLVEARRLEVFDDVLTIVACREAGGIRDPKQHGWKRLTQESVSDLLAELDCYMSALTFRRDQVDTFDLRPKALRDARDNRAVLAKRFGVPANPPEKRDDRSLVVRAVMAGLINHLHHKTHGFYMGSDRAVRELTSGSVVSGGEWVLAVPFDLETRNRHNERIILNLLGQVTVVEPAILAELAPHLVSEQPLGLRYNVGEGAVMAATSVRFDGQEISVRHEPVGPSEETTKVLAAALVSGQAFYADQDYNRVRIDAYNRIASNRLWRLSRIDDELFTTLLAAKIAVQRMPVARLADLEGIDLKIDLKETLPDDLQNSYNLLESQILEIDGVEIYITYRVGFLGRAMATARLRADQAVRLSGLPELADAEYERIELTEDGKVVVEGYWFNQVVENYRAKLVQRRRTGMQAALEAKLSELQSQMRKLADDGRPTYALTRLMDDLHRKVYWARYQDDKLSEAHNLARAVEREIERITTTPVREYLLQDLLNGKCPHPDVDHNQRVLFEIEGYEVRTGGVITAPSEKELRAHYERCLGGIKHAARLSMLNLRLDISNYVDEQFLDEMAAAGELVLAPASIEFINRRREPELFPVRYGYTIPNKGSVPVRTAIVRIPLKIYEINKPEHGKASPFTGLPHGIIMLVEVTVDNKVVARGEAGDQLDKRIKSHRRGQNRSSALSTDADNSLINPWVRRAGGSWMTDGSSIVW